MSEAETEDDPMARARLRLGTTLRGKYKLDSVLGIGGMAVVYKATHRNGAEYAVKVLHRELSARTDIRTRFLREGRAANSIKHDGVVAVVDDDVAEDGSAFLVLELLDGMSVDRLWESCGRRLPVRATLSIGAQLLDVLTATHERGIVHRDIKPANLFITRQGALKVLDFGIARVRDSAGGGATLATGTGFVLGTPGFMAPELALAKSDEVDAQTDLWAVGATLFLILAGRLVHDGDNSAQLLVHSATIPPRPLASVCDDVPAPLGAAVDRAIAFNKSERWQRAEQMRAELEAVSLELFHEPTSRAALAAAVGDAVARDEAREAAKRTRGSAGLRAALLDTEAANMSAVLRTAADIPPSTGQTSTPAGSDALVAGTGAQHPRRPTLAAGFAVALLAGGGWMLVRTWGQPVRGAERPEVQVLPVAEAVRATSVEATETAPIAPPTILSDAGAARAAPRTVGAERGRPDSSHPSVGHPHAPSTDPPITPSAPPRDKKSPLDITFQ